MPASRRWKIYVACVIFIFNRKTEDIEWEKFSMAAVNTQTNFNAVRFASHLQFNTDMRESTGEQLQYANEFFPSGCLAFESACAHCVEGWVGSEPSEWVGEKWLTLYVFLFTFLGRCYAWADASEHCSFVPSKLPTISADILRLFNSCKIEQ